MIKDLTKYTLCDECGELILKEDLHHCTTCGKVTCIKCISELKNSKNNCSFCDLIDKHPEARLMLISDLTYDKFKKRYKDGNRKFIEEQDKEYTDFINEIKTEFLKYDSEEYFDELYAIQKEINSYNYEIECYSMVQELGGYLYGFIMAKKIYLRDKLEMTESIRYNIENIEDNLKYIFVDSSDYYSITKLVDSL